MPRYFATTEHIISAQHIRQNYRATAKSPEEELKLTVKQYTPHDNPTPAEGDITIIACHAAGFFKELYEPFFDDLYESSRQSGHSFRIGSIWIADMVTHGASGILNEGRLGLDLHYDDHARDLLCMVNAFRSQMRIPMVGIGHSMGTIQILKMALIHPSLFASIVCIEPIVTRSYQHMHLGAVGLLTFRPDIWPSRDDAARAARESALFAGWDERTMQIFIDRGFRDLPTPLYPQAPPKIARQALQNSSIPVTLTTTRHHDAKAYARAAMPSREKPLSSFQPSRRTHPDITKEEHEQLGQPFYRPEAVHVHRLLHLLQPSCHWIYGAKTPFTSAMPEGRAAKMKATGSASGGNGGAAEGKVSETVLSVGSHYVPFEKPRVVAEEVASSLDRMLQGWTREIEPIKNAYAGISDYDKTTLDEDWKWWAKEVYGASSRKKGQTSQKPSSKL